jgi:beta-glucanase (GH16 family)
VRRRTVALLSALGIGVATAIAVPMLGTASAATFDQQTWVDDFDGPAGSRVDTSKWVYETGFGEQWGNNEYQTYTDSTNNVRLNGKGQLVITARKEVSGYTSGRLKTMGKFSQKYGKFEANIKIPRGPGLLPAFWAMGNTGGWPANGEIDIMENVGGEPKTVYGTVHGSGFTGADTTGRGGHKTIGAELSADFHRYGIEWAPNSITWTLDGVAYKTTTPSNIGGARWPFNDQPFYMLLNVAVGGDWPGKPVDSVLPQEMVVDYVKVFAYNENGTPTPSKTTTATAQPPVTGATPIVGLANKCIDVFNGDNVPPNGTPVVLYDCHGRANQKWLFVNGTVRSMGKCLDVTDANPANGTKLQVTGCGTQSAQQFVLQSNGQIRNALSGRCVDVAERSSANATRLQIWDCNPGQDNQTWRKG